MSITIIGLIGCGNVGTVVVQAILEGRLNATIGPVFDVDVSRARNLADLAGRSDAFKSDFNEFLEEDMDLVIFIVSSMEG